MQTLDNNQKTHYTLRIAAAMCFIGHGAFGIITKAIWCNYFAIFGIDQVHEPLLEILGNVVRHPLNSVQIELIAATVRRRAPRLHASRADAHAGVEAAAGLHPRRFQSSRL